MRSRQGKYSKALPSSPVSLRSCVVLRSHSWESQALCCDLKSYLATLPVSRRRENHLVLAGNRFELQVVIRTFHC